MRPRLPEQRESECTREIKQNCQLTRDKQEQIPSKNSPNGLIIKHSSWKQGKPCRWPNIRLVTGPFEREPSLMTAATA